MSNINLWCIYLLYNDNYGHITKKKDQQGKKPACSVGNKVKRKEAFLVEEQSLGWMDGSCMISPCT